VALDAQLPQGQGLRKRPRPQVMLLLVLIAAAFPVRFAGVGGHTVSLFDLAVFITLVPLMAYATRFHRLHRPPTGVMVGITVPVTYRRRVRRDGAA
jgi:hypothetical protein